MNCERVISDNAHYGHLLLHYVTVLSGRVKEHRVDVFAVPVCAWAVTPRAWLGASGAILWMQSVA